MDQLDRIEVNIHDAMLLAGECFRASRFAEAEEIFRGIHKAEPLNFHACHSIGVCLLEQEKVKEALPWIDQAGALLRDELISVGCNRGKALAELGKAEEALSMLNTLVKANPEHTLSRYSRGLVLLQMGQHEEAITDLEWVIAKENENYNARFAKGFANLVLGNYDVGFSEYEYRRKDVIDEPDASLWTGKEDLKGKTILVHGEQGLGDNIMFARYLPLLRERGAIVYVWIPEVCRPLLKHLDIILLNDDRQKWPETDYWVRFMSLALCFKTTLETVPLPVPLAKGCVKKPLTNMMSNLVGFDKKLRIGLCWAGSPTSRYDQHRSIPLEKLKPLFDLDATFICLQKDIREDDKDTFDGLEMEEPWLESFRDTAEVMAGLDLVVTCDTSVAHLAGTVGVPTFIMLTAFRTYWLWIAKQTISPWYPTVRLFRQEKDGDWAPVVADVMKAIRAF